MSCSWISVCIPGIRGDLSGDELSGVVSPLAVGLAGSSGVCCVSTWQPCTYVNTLCI